MKKIIIRAVVSIAAMSILAFGVFRVSRNAKTPTVGPAAPVKTAGPFTTCQWPNTCAQVAFIGPCQVGRLCKQVKVATLTPCLWPNLCANS